MFRSFRPSRSCTFWRISPKVVSAVTGTANIPRVVKTFTSGTWSWQANSGATLKIKLFRLYSDLNAFHDRLRIQDSGWILEEKAENQGSETDRPGQTSKFRLKGSSQVKLWMPFGRCGGHARWLDKKSVQPPHQEAPWSLQLSGHVCTEQDSCICLSEPTFSLTFQVF